ncbi:Uncharacterised protein [uncultured archaeon]|nr:Uncharacterised protein [uncultured archaeon]
MAFWILAASPHAQPALGISSCYFSLDLKTDAPVYVQPSNVLINYTIHKSSTSCFPASGNFIGILTFLSASSGIAVENLQLSIPSTDLDTISGAISSNTSVVPAHGVIAQMYVKYINFANQTSVHFYTILPGRLVTDDLEVVPSSAAAGSRVSIVGNVTNTGQLAVTNATALVNVTTLQGVAIGALQGHLGTINPGEKRGFSISLDLLSNSGAYAASAIVAYDDAYAYAGKSYYRRLKSDARSARYDIKQTSSPILGANSSTLPTSVGPIVFSSVPVYASFVGGSIDTKLGLYNPSNNSVSVDISDTSSASVRIVPSVSSLTLKSGEMKTVTLQISSLNSSQGTYTLPVNMSASYVSNNAVHVVKGNSYIFVRVKSGQGALLPYAHTYYLSGINGTVSEQFVIYNSANKRANDVLLEDLIPRAAIENASQITGAGAATPHVSLFGDAYAVSWDIPGIEPHQTAVLNGTAVNLSLGPVLKKTPIITLAYTYDNVSPLSLVNVTPPSVYTNDTGKKFAVYVAYSGTTPLNVTYLMSLVSPLVRANSPVVIDPYLTLHENPNTIQNLTFEIQSTPAPGTYLYELAIIGGITGKTYPVLLTVAGKPAEAGSGQTQAITIAATCLAVLVIAGVLLYVFRHRGKSKARNGGQR